ncbi:hypothetical protein BDP55DRAFT_366778 [Colletotrichum godetiae]|uniref:Uncharacterized protein n=1 Tax=Colletotrichum godetiae TaxID=1209918 RepID=A0AAJ0ACN8_9PEZI|nr:uncharacterized protein BDP55DRAFT_366778 [Colletotrichum godetiae]KAK1659186.1 hypothetical protein BDP55DRAFT_366778 [Colletotrichum godetiae]
MRHKSFTSVAALLSILAELLLSGIPSSFLLRLSPFQVFDTYSMEALKLCHPVGAMPHLAWPKSVTFLFQGGRDRRSEGLFEYCFPKPILCLSLEYIRHSSVANLESAVRVPSISKTVVLYITLARHQKAQKKI